MTCEHGYIGACPEGCDVPQEEPDLSCSCDVIESLAIQSLDRVRSGDLRAAFWRLVDAAGLISRIVDVHELQPTGRGFYVVNAIDNDRSMEAREVEGE